jgi:hypothetical protein
VRAIRLGPVRPAQLGLRGPDRLRAPDGRPGLEADGLTQADFYRLLRVLEGGSCWIKLSSPYRIAKSRPFSSPLGRARRGVAGPADLGFGLAAAAWRATRHRRAGQPDRGVGVRRADQRRILVEGPWTFFFDD